MEVLGVGRSLLTWMVRALGLCVRFFLHKEMEMSDLGETSYSPPPPNTHTHRRTHTQAETAVGCLGPASLFGLSCALLEHLLLLFAHPIVSNSFLPHGL